MKGVSANGSSAPGGEEQSRADVLFLLAALQRLHALPAPAQAWLPGLRVPLPAPMSPHGGALHPKAVAPASLASPIVGGLL